MTTTGHYIGYCQKCNTSSFYKEFEIKSSDSMCCNSKLLSNKGAA